jgi:hypothetical protein
MSGRKICPPSGVAVMPSSEMRIFHAVPHDASSNEAVAMIINFMVCYGLNELFRLPSSNTSPMTTTTSLRPSRATRTVPAIVCQLSGNASRLMVALIVDTMATVPTNALNMFVLFIVFFVV